MTQSAHTFTPKDDSLTERMNAYFRVRRDYDAFKVNTETLDADSLGEQEDIAKAHKILSESLRMAFEAIDESELQEAVRQGIYSNDEFISFIQSKQKLEMEIQRYNQTKQSDSNKHSHKR